MSNIVSAKNRPSEKTLTVRFPKGGDIRVFKMRFDLSKRNHTTVFSFLSKSGFYEPDVSTFLVRALETGDACIDVGANQGYYALLCSALVGEAGRVIACEPDEGNRKDILANLSLNTIKNVLVIPRALTEKVEEREFFINHVDSGGHALWDITEFPGNEREGGAEGVHRLKTSTLDSVVEQSGLKPGEVKCIKIDTEGAEELILRGGTTTLSKYEIPFVVTELHEFGLKKLGCSQESLRAIMAGFGYDCYVLGLKGGFPYFVPPGVRIQSRFILNLCFAQGGALRSLYPTVFFDPLSF